MTQPTLIRPPRLENNTFNIGSAQHNVDKIIICTITGEWHLTRTSHSSCHDDVVIGLRIKTDDVNFNPENYDPQQTHITRRLYRSSRFVVTQGASSFRVRSGCITAVYLNDQRIIY